MRSENADKTRAEETSADENENLGLMPSRRGVMKLTAGFDPAISPGRQSAVPRPVRRTVP